LILWRWKSSVSFTRASGDNDGNTQGRAIGTFCHSGCLRDSGRPLRAMNSEADLPSDRHGTTRRSPVIEVAAGLVFRGGKVLITQRYPEAHLGGLWEFPGGKREATETFEQCLARELREELGIDVQVEEAIAGITHSYPEKTVQLKFFRCRWKANEPQALGCADFRWVGADEFQHYRFPAADVQLLDQLRSSPALWM